MKTQRVVSRILALVVVVASALFGSPAQAGTLQVRDAAHVLSSEDLARVRAAVDAAPFDARLLVTTEYPDAQELSRAVHQLASERVNVVAMGLDPEHRHVQVHFEEHVRVPRSAWPEIEHAGNDAFRGHRWGDGLAMIVQAASSAAQPGSGVAAPVGSPAASRTSLLGPGLLLLLVVAAVGVGVYFSSRRRNADGLPPGAGGGYGPGPGYGPGGYGAGGYGPGAYAGPGYGPGPGAGRGMGPVGGGLVGAGLGGLAGYELGKLAGEREDRGRDRPDWSDREDVGGRDDGPADAGGGGSSWDDDGSGSDSGGGDDGGGFGGDDGGGGGGDF